MFLAIFFFAVGTNWVVSGAFDKHRGVGQVFLGLGIFLILIGFACIADWMQKKIVDAIEKRKNNVST